MRATGRATLAVVILGLVGTLGASGTVGCSSSPPSRHVERTLGGFQVTVEDSPPRIVVRAGTRTLADVDGRAFAFRASSATYKEVYGSFQIADAEGPFTNATRFGSIEDAADATATHGALDVVLESASGTLGRVRIALEGDLHLSITATPSDPSQNRARMAMACALNDHFTGLGAQTADVDHRGQRVPLFLSEHGVGKSDVDDDTRGDWFLRGNKHSSYTAIPAVTTSRGTAWVLDTYAYSVFDLCATSADAVGLEAWEGTLRFHLFDGPSPLEALARMTSFVGRPPMPPPWAFAPWNDAAFGSDSVRAFAKFLRDEQIPTSAIWSEDWRGGFTTTYGYRLKPNWRVDPTLYPDFGTLTKELEQLGIAMQVYFNAHVIASADVFADAIAGKEVVTHASTGANYFVSGADGTMSDTYFTDLTRPESRAWAKGLLREAMDLGARGWMADFGEWLPVDDARLASGVDPALAHNQYPRLWQEVNNEAIAEAGLTGKVGVYYRSASLRSQSTAGILWAGDQRTDMEPDNGMPVIVPVGLGLASTGFPFFAHDIGGYQYLGNTPTEVRTKETFFRWTELGAFTPVMRTHHGIKARENWSLDSDAETTAHWKRYASLHVQLYPYLRALALRAVNEGRPLWIPMGLLHPEDEAVWPLRDQFYLGDAMLVAPVVTAGAVSRAVRLPAGRHVPMVTGPAVTGPVTVTVDAPLGEIPVFLRAGGIVPMTATPAMTLFENVAGVPGLETTRGDRIVYVALGASGAFTEEDGASYTLDGDGTDASSLGLGADGGLDVTGDAVVRGAGFTLTLAGHAASRKTRIVFR